jgi:hypothetical protein
VLLHCISNQDEYRECESQEEDYRSIHVRGFRDRSLNAIAFEPEDVHRLSQRVPKLAHELIGASTGVRVAVELMYWQAD